MGRPLKGWKLRPKRNGIQAVRFTHEGKRFELGTGERDIDRASQEAARIYADVLAGRRVAPDAPRAGGVSLAEVAAEWLTDSPLSPGTVAEYAGYFSAHLCPHFGTLAAACHPARQDAYTRARLRVVRAASVRKELSALRGALLHAYTIGLVSSVPTVAGVPRHVTGTPYAAKRTRGPVVEVTPAEVAAILAKLPAVYRGQPIQAYFTVFYETTLRPATLSQLSVPEHWAPGAAYLTIPREIDKARAGRPVPLSDAARAALEGAAPAAGVIFGRHDFRVALRRAARGVLPPAKAARLAPYDLRHARISHFVDRGELGAAHYMAGHKHVSTTARYAHPGLAAAERAVLGNAKGEHVGE